MSHYTFALNDPASIRSSQTALQQLGLPTFFRLSTGFGLPESGVDQLNLVRRALVGIEQASGPASSERARQFSQLALLEGMFSAKLGAPSIFDQGGLFGPGGQTQPAVLGPPVTQATPPDPRVDPLAHHDVRASGGGNGNGDGSANAVWPLALLAGLFALFARRR